MAIASFDQYVGAYKQIVPYTKTSAVTTVANTWFAVHQQAGNPAAGTLAASATIAIGGSGAGVVPDDTVSGYPTIVANTGSYYLSRVEYANTVASRMMVYDRLWHANIATTSNGTATVSAPGSFSARLPASSYVGLWIVLEVTTSPSATTPTVTYTNQAGTTGRSTGATASMNGFVAGRWVLMPLQTGDTGVQKIETVVTSGTSSSGAINVAIVRPLWSGRVNVANLGDVHGVDRTGLPQIYATSALGLIINADSTSSGLPDMLLEIASA